MYFNINNSIDESTLNILINQINNLKDGILTIYFTCPNGGLTDTGEALIHLINTNKDRITIIFYGELFSMGMNIFLRTSCSKVVLPDTRGMYHYTWQDIAINESGKPLGEYEKFSLSELKKAKKRSLETIDNLPLTEKESKAMKSGKDVYFSYERMKELI